MAEEKSSKMFIYGLCLVSFVALVHGSGELSILHSPKSIRFDGGEKFEQSLLKEIYSTVFGYTIDKSSRWSGLYIDDPFHYPEAIVNIVVDGVESLGDFESVQGPHFPLETDEDEDETWQAMEMRIEEHHPEGNNTLIRVELDKGLEALEPYATLIEGIKIHMVGPNQGELNLEIEEDRKFLEEIYLLNGIIDKIKSGGIERDYKQDLYWFVVSGLHSVSDLHGSDSKATAEAKTLLKSAILRLSSVISKAYHGNVLVTALATDAGHTRKTRSLLAEAAVDNECKDCNLAQQYSADYPVIFNIILWFGVAFIFSLIAICIAIGTMDPGRDSIIYRMTSNRMKKDN